MSIEKGEYIFYKNIQLLVIAPFNLHFFYFFSFRVVLFVFRIL